MLLLSVFTNEVKSYAENQDIADIRKIRQRKVGHEASDKYCDYCYDTLKIATGTAEKIQPLP